MAQLIVRLVPVAELIDDAAGMAQNLRHPVYDCIYLAQARLEHVPLVTADERQFAACSRGGIDARLL
jgi:predicted nucleic acid-binding protein